MSMLPDPMIVHSMPSIIENYDSFNVRDWGLSDYLPVWRAMQQFTEQRTEKTKDEIWLVEHNPVYTLGQRATYEDRLALNPIPIVHTDRGGRITYHGPGQLVIYPLLDLNKLECHLRMLVNALENTLIQLLSDYQIKAYADPKAPGIYIEGAKVASLGLRIRKGCSYHGLAVNIDMDMTPFQAIRPCGLQHIKMTQITDWIGPVSIVKIGKEFLSHWCQQPCYHQ